MSVVVVVCAMLELDDVTIGWEGRIVVRIPHLRVKAGEVIGLLGRNGVGKSTLLRVLAGQQPPLSGRVMVAGHAAHAAAARQEVGYVPERVPISDDLTVLEQLRFAASLRLPTASSAAAVEQQLHRLAIQDSADRLCGQLSKGTRQRVGLAQALLSSPQLLLLDEPSSGVDVDQQARMMVVLREEANRGAAVVLSTHVRDDVSLLQPRLLTIHDGELREGS
jgi:ABC-2 type transport system ATP-binding protein